MSGLPSPDSFSLVAFVSLPLVAAVASSRRASPSRNLPFHHLVLESSQRRCSCGRASSSTPSSIARNLCYSSFYGKISFLPLSSLTDMWAQTPPVSGIASGKTRWGHCLVAKTNLSLILLFPQHIWFPFFTFTFLCLNFVSLSNGPSLLADIMFSTEL